MMTMIGTLTLLCWTEAVCTSIRIARSRTSETPTHTQHIPIVPLTGRTIETVLHTTLTTEFNIQ